MIRLELGRGPFLRPVLVRAVRAAGVQAGLDVGLLAIAAAAAEAVATEWAIAAPDGPLRVAIDREPGSLSMTFGFADHAVATAARAAPGLPTGDARDGGISARLHEGSPSPGCDLLLVVS